MKKKTFRIVWFDQKPTSFICLEGAELSDIQSLKAKCFSICSKNRNHVYNAAGPHAVDVLLLKALTDLGFVLKF